IRGKDPCDGPKEGGFAASVLADDTHDPSFGHGKADTFQRLIVIPPLPDLAKAFLKREGFHAAVCYFYIFYLNRNLTHFPKPPLYMNSQTGTSTSVPHRATLRKLPASRDRDPPEPPVRK